MNSAAPAYRRMSWMLAAGAMVWLAMTVHVLRTTPRRLARLARKEASWQQLESMRRETAAWRQAIREHEARYEGFAPRPWEDVINEFFPDSRGSLPPARETPAALGYRWLRQEITLQEVGVHELADLLYRAETSAPPWRLAEIHIEAAPLPGQLKKATLLFESLAPPESGPAPDPGEPDLSRQAAP